MRNEVLRLEKVTLREQGGLPSKKSLRKTATILLGCGYFFRYIKVPKTTEHNKLRSISTSVNVILATSSREDCGNNRLATF